jgi:ferrous iron transport protein B
MAKVEATRTARGIGLHQACYACAGCTALVDTIAAGAATLTVALAGNPNSGKTTIFNALTGLRHKVGNYPGVTVEKKTGCCRLPSGPLANIIDLPGAYSLMSRSPDEVVAMEVLRGLRPDTPAPEVVVAVLDASNLQRNLYLVSQLIEMGRPLVVALNMMDIAERRGLPIAPGALERELGVPVVPVVGHKRKGIAALKQAIAAARVAPQPDWPLPPAMKDELTGLARVLARRDGAAVAERLLVGDRAADVTELVRREPIATRLAIAAARLHEQGIDPVQADIEAHYRWIEQVAQRSQAPPEQVAVPSRPEPSGRYFSERVDAVLIHRVWGLLIFAAIMGTIFLAIFWLAAPIQHALRDGVDWLGAAVASRLPAGALHSLVRNGIFAGVGSVLIFVPQIAILFLCLAFLEDSGYLARAAFLIDRLLAGVGLHGKSFIPLLSAFACAIPGILAARTIESRKDRLVTILVLPFMTCSARLPVYVLLVGAFFAPYGILVQAGLMLALYLSGIVAALGAVWLFKRTLLRGPAAAFILELPTYKLPQVSVIGRQVWTNTTRFLTKAGTTIFCLSLLLWAMAYYPRLPADRAAQYADDNARASAQLAHSIAGRLGRAIEPAIRPLGFDWKMGVGCLGAFAAREVFVSTMAIIYGTGTIEHGTSDLSAAMRTDHYPDGRPVWTPLAAASLLLWFVLAMQCLSTLLVVRQETGGWTWPAVMFVYMNALAYVGCLVLYQVGSVALGNLS